MISLCPAVLAVLLAQASQPAAPPVAIEMRNVTLHVASDAVIEVRWLSGRLRSTSAHPPVFDDQNSFTIEVEDGEVAVDAPSLTALVNRAFDYKGAALSGLRLSFDGGHLVQRGTLKKGISVAFSIVADVSATADGRLNVHPLKVKTAGIPTAKLMSMFGVELDDLLKSRPDRGIVYRDNDLFLDAARMMPAPHMPLLSHRRTQKLSHRGTQKNTGKTAPGKHDDAVSFAVCLFEPRTGSREPRIPVQFS